MERFCQEYLKAPQIIRLVPPAAAGAAPQPKSEPSALMANPAFQERIARAYAAAAE